MGFGWRDELVFRIAKAILAPVTVGVDRADSPAETVGSR